MTTRYDPDMGPDALDEDQKQPPIPDGLDATQRMAMRACRDFVASWFEKQEIVLHEQHDRQAALDQPTEVIVTKKLVHDFTGCTILEAWRTVETSEKYGYDQTGQARVWDQEQETYTVVFDHPVYDRVHVSVVTTSTVTGYELHNVTNVFVHGGQWQVSKFGRGVDSLGYALDKPNENLLYPQPRSTVTVPPIPIPGSELVNRPCQQCGVLVAARPEVASVVCSVCSKVNGLFGSAS